MPQASTAASVCCPTHATLTPASARASSPSSSIFSRTALTALTDVMATGDSALRPCSTNDAATLPIDRTQLTKTNVPGDEASDAQSGSGASGPTSTMWTACDFLSVTGTPA